MSAGYVSAFVCSLCQVIRVSNHHAIKIHWGKNKTPSIPSIGTRWKYHRSQLSEQEFLVCAVIKSLDSHWGFMKHNVVVVFHNSHLFS